MQLESMKKKQVCKNINNMYLQVLSSAMGTSCGTEKFHRDKGFNFKMIVEQSNLHISKATRFKIEK